MRTFSALFLSMLITSPAFAAPGKVTQFTCTAEKELQKHRVTLTFSLRDVASDSPHVMGRMGRQFKIIPKTDALRALNTADNMDVNKTSKGVVIDSDEIGMMHTTLFLYSDRGYRSGYVQTSGEVNERLYSPITCELN